MQERPDSEHTSVAKADRLSRLQQILLIVFLFVYPSIQFILNYLNPPDLSQIQSRILELYLPSLLLQILVYAVIALALFRDNEPLATLGLRRRDFSPTNIGIGVAFLIVAVIVLNILSRTMIYFGMTPQSDISYLMPKTTLERIFWIILAASAGISEEICFRGFVITRLGRLTGSVWPGAIIGAIAFGASHSYQGIGGIVLIGLYGFMFSLLFLARGTLVPCIVAHALQDMIALFGY
jgi:membrane protease YdiL (CAAX protease family)